MKNGTKLGLILCGTILVLGLVVFISVAGFALYSISAGTQRARENYKKRTAETPGTITDVSHYKSSNSGKYGGSGSWSSTYTYQYVVNSVAYTAEKTSPGKDEGKTGVKVKVCYDPSDPKSSDFYFSETDTSNREKTVCGGTSQ